jgi:hypothetical protein
MREIDRNEYERLPLRVHSFLAGVPLRTLQRVELPGGRAGMTLPEINAVLEFSSAEGMEVGLVTRALFWLRNWIGRLLGWEDAEELIASHTWLTRLSAEERGRSLVTPGQVEGISRVLYCFEREMLAEIINRTVHCFWVMAAEETASGYELWMAVYVKKLNWFTPVYMALITPMLKLIIYPSMMKGVKRRWERAFPVKSNEQGNAKPSEVMSWKE